MTTRERSISTIEALYPADSEYESSRAIGIKLLEEAKRNTSNWRNLPDAVLFEYERLCIREEERQDRAAAKKLKGY